jgi:hypothetical protein
MRRCPRGAGHASSALVAGRGKSPIGSSTSSKGGTRRRVGVVEGPDVDPALRVRMTWKRRRSNDDGARENLCAHAFGELPSYVASVATETLGLA